jgi:hypothetical protein
MSNISKPSFALGYWKPFDENQNFYESYQLYIRDVSLQRYNAEIIGRYIDNANENIIQTINKSVESLGYDWNVTNDHLSKISYGIKSMIYSVRIQIEQQKATNILLHDIKSLLRLPDSERERIHAIELGLKFFSNAKKDKDLFTDALEEFLKAERLMGQDYFVLHRIGLIYLLTEDHLNVEKALEYFMKAAKYASVESNSKIKTLAYFSNDHEFYERTNTSNLNIAANEIKKMASESFERAAFAAYVLGEMNNAVTLQKKALQFNKSAQNEYFLGKYLMRSGKFDQGLKYLDRAVENLPEIMELIARDFDLNIIAPVIDWINKKVEFIDHKINLLRIEWKNSNSPKKNKQIESLGKLVNKRYPERVVNFQRSSKELSDYRAIEERSKSDYRAIEERSRSDLNSLYSVVESIQFFSSEFDKNELLNSIKNFQQNKNSDEMDELHKQITQWIWEDQKARNDFNLKIQSQQEESKRLNVDILGFFYGVVMMILAFVGANREQEIFSYLIIVGILWLIMMIFSNDRFKLMAFFGVLCSAFLVILWLFYKIWVF